jgi:flagellum-specific peptidoglycan hydrolase FlgJ
MLTRQIWTQQNYPVAYRLTQGTGIFPETLLAIAIVESQGRVNGVWYPGQGLVARRANNFFGIKRGVNWNGPTIDLPTPGDADKISTFRVYPTFEASAKDFIKFLQTNQRYRRAGVFTSPNYQEQILAIARAGYAEGPQYADIITRVANGVKKATKTITNQFAKHGSWIIPLTIIGVFFLTLQRNKKHEAIFGAHNDN